MAMKARVSLIRGMIVATATYGLVFLLWAQNIPHATMNATQEPRTTSHKPAKKATIHGSRLNIARVRKKKRRDVDMIVRPKKMAISVLTSPWHVTAPVGAEE